MRASSVYQTGLFSYSIGTSSSLIEYRQKYDVISNQILGCVKMDISSFLKKWSTLFVKKVNPFREKGQPFLRKRSTLSEKKVNPFCEKGQPFLKKQSTLSEKTVNPF